MSRASKSGKKARAPKQVEAGYLEQTHRPLHCLVFLLPLMVAYEIGLAVAHAGAAGQQPDLVAVDLLRRFLAVFGATGYHLPALAVVAILLAWHVVAKEPWKVHWPTMLGMMGESVLLAVGLQGLNFAVGRVATVLPMAGAHTTRIWFDQLVLSLGAGIYEELVFRLILISVLSLVLIDVLRLPKELALAAIIVIRLAGVCSHTLSADRE